MFVIHNPITFFTDCKLTAKGYVIQVPGKATSHRFLIPKENTAGDRDIAFFQTFHRYVRKMKRDLKTPGADSKKPLGSYRLFVRVENKAYTRHPLGKNHVGTVGKWVAQQLGKPDWDTFTNRSLSRVDVTNMTVLSQCIIQGW